MDDRDEGNPAAGEPVDVRVKTRHMLGAMRKAFGMPSPEKTSAARVIRKSPRVAVEMPFSYRAVKNNVVMPETFRGTIMEFICVSERNEKLLMHCMLHAAFADNAILGEYLSQLEEEANRKTAAWRITKRIVIIALLVVSSAFFYLLSTLTEALKITH
jgi:hypothetical protein